MANEQMVRAMYTQQWPGFDKQAKGRAFRGKTADYLILDDKIGEFKVTSDEQKDLHAWVSKELNKAHRRIMDKTKNPPPGISFATHGTNLHMDFEALEKRVLADTGCTPEMLVNKRKVGKAAALAEGYGMGWQRLSWQDGDVNASCYVKKDLYKFNIHGTTTGRFSSRKPNEEYNMNKVTNPTFIGDSRASDISDNGIIQRIRQNEDEVRGLKQIKTKSKKIAKRIRKLQASCTQMAGILDAR